MRAGPGRPLAPASEIQSLRASPIGRRAATALMFISWTLIVSVVPPSLLSNVLFQSNPEHIVPSSHSAGDASQ